MTLLKSIRNFKCFNQKELIKYEFLVSERHKKLRKYLDNEEIDTLTLEKLVDDLINISYDYLLDIFKQNVTHIKNIFDSAGIDQEPRITIKVMEEYKTVLDIFRSEGTASFTTSSVNDNTGFKSIMDFSTKLNFMSNDLEEDFKNGIYKNPRLNDELRTDLIEGNINWEDCWHPLQDGDDKKYAYRSTVIIPMSLKAEDSDPKEFIKHFFEDVEYSGGKRTVWGFLCFDYEEKNIFLDKEETVENIGYIIADELSLYLIFFYNHIFGSHTFNKALINL